jgi:nitrite reductase/ring-hydroxylating ferredoxin subunit
MTEKKVSRRSFLRWSAVAGAAAITTYVVVRVSGNKGEKKHTLMSRIQGIPLTDPPENPNAWAYEDGALFVTLADVPELDAPGSAVRIEGEVLAIPILVVHGDDDKYYAYLNACTHAGRMIDPAAGTLTLECCSVSGSTYDYAGKVLSGPAESPLTTYPVEVDGGQMVIGVG